MDPVTLLIAVVGIPALILVTVLLGMGRSRKIEGRGMVEAALADMVPGVLLVDVLISNSGRQAIGLTDDGRVILLKVMGQDISSRLVRPGQLAVSFRADRVPRLRVALDETGFPPLTLICDRETGEQWKERLQ